MDKSLLINRLTKSITSFSVNKIDLKRLLDILQVRSYSACDIECIHVTNIVTPDNIEKSKEDLKECSLLIITITGFDNIELTGPVEEIFNSVSFPERIKSLYLNSEIPYRSKFNYYPRNHFELLLDFSKPDIFDFSFQPSDKTPNGSRFKVQGYDNTWVNGVFYEINLFFQNNPAKFSRIHRSSFYDFLVWFFGIPFGFWVCSKISTYVEASLVQNIFLKNAVYLYMFLISLFLIRIIFHYSRWVYPMIEFKTDKERSLIHRGILYSLLLGVIGSLLYDIFKLLFV